MAYAPWPASPDDAPNRELRQTRIDMLCAYLHLPCTPEVDLPDHDTGARHTYMALREIRHTVIRLIRDHLRLPPEHPNSWQGHDFDFAGVTFDGGDFSGIHVTDARVNFDRTTFSGGRAGFSEAIGSAPSGLVPHDGSSLPTGLTLPEAWHPADH